MNIRYFLDICSWLHTKNAWCYVAIYCSAAVLIARNKLCALPVFVLVGLFIRPPACYAWAPEFSNSKTKKRRKIRIGMNKHALLPKTGITRVPIFRSMHA